jgi:ribonucleoside-diphosphate reductase alpha chain
MGFADLLVRIGVPYDSEEGVEVGRRIMEFLDEEAKKESERLAETARHLPGVGAVDLGPGRELRPRAQRRPDPPERRLRNCNVDTVAPTGTISIIAGAPRGSSRSSPWPSCATRPAC